MKKQGLMFLAAALCCIHYTYQSDSSWADRQLRNMTTRQKIGQLFVVATASNFDQPEEILASALLKCPYRMEHDYITQLITEYAIGGLVFLFKSTPAVQINVMNHFQSISRLPLLICQDCEWGLNMRLYETIGYPHNMTLGAIQDETLMYRLGQEIGRQCKAIGVNLNIAPVVDVNNNSKNPVINDRSFGEDPTKVARYALLYTQGLTDSGVFACAKHYPGHGDTDVDSHYKLPRIKHNRSHLDSVELVPFRRLIEAGVPAIMSAHLLVSDLDSDCPATYSKAIITDLLQNRLQFSGLKITDGLGMEALMNSAQPGQIELQALLAGHDILLCPLDVPRAVELIETAIKTGQFCEAELDARVLKILQAKEKLGLTEKKMIDPTHAVKQLWTDEAVALKKELYYKAVTIVKNEENLLPLAKNSPVALIVIGGLSENPYVTILKNYVTDVVAVPANQIEQKNDELQACVANVDTVIIGIYGMNKFAARQFGITNETLALLESLKNMGKKTIVTLFGNPYSLELFQMHDALVMAYEEDRDAQCAAAEAIVGLYRPTGKLPVSSGPFIAGTGMAL